MAIPSDPGTGIQDNNKEPIKVGGATGLHARFKPLYDALNGALDFENIDLTADYPWTGIHSFLAGNLKIGGAGAGYGLFQYANSATDRTLTIPDPGADASFVMTEGAQTVNGAKTFSDLVTATSGLTADGVITANSGILADEAVALDLVTNGNRIDLDADNDTSIRCSTDDTIVVELGGSDHITINSNGEVLLPDVDPPTANYMNRNSTLKAFGKVASNGSLSHGYNCVQSSKSATGKYSVEIDTNFSTLRTLVATGESGGSGVISVGNGLSTTSATIWMYDTSVTLADGNFHFMCAGVQ